MPRYDSYEEATRAERGEMIKKTYMEYADPNSGELVDPQAFQNKVVQNMYRYGDVEGIREFTATQKQSTALDLQQQQDILKIGGAAADAVSSTYNTFVKQFGKEKADEMIAPLYDAFKEPISRSGVKMQLPEKYDHNATTLLAKHYRSWLGKDISKDEDGGASGSDPAGVKLFKQMYPGVALDSPQGRAQYIALEKQLKNDPYLPMAVQMTMGDPRTIKMTPEQLQARIQQNYEIVQKGTPGAGRPRSAGAKTIDPETAKALLQEAGGDKNKARQLAKQRGYKF